MCGHHMVSSNIVRLIAERVRKARYWATHYAPERLAFRIIETVDERIISELTEPEKEALGGLRLRLKLDEATGFPLKSENVANAIRETAQSHSIDIRRFYEVIYLVLLGKPSGPKLSTFIPAIRDDAARLFGQIR